MTRTKALVVIDRFLIDFASFMQTKTYAWIFWCSLVTFGSITVFFSENRWMALRDLLIFGGGGAICSFFGQRLLANWFEGRNRARQNKITKRNAYHHELLKRLDFAALFGFDYLDEPLEQYIDELKETNGTDQVFKISEPPLKPFDEYHETLYQIWKSR